MKKLLYLKKSPPTKKCLPAHAISVNNIRRATNILHNETGKRQARAAGLLHIKPQLCGGASCWPRVMMIATALRKYTQKRRFLFHARVAALLLLAEFVILMFLDYKGENKLRALF